eukprot:gene12570-18395_t
MRGRAELLFGQIREIVYVIVSFLSPEDLARTGRVCQTWMDASKTMLRLHANATVALGDRMLEAHGGLNDMVKAIVAFTLVDTALAFPDPSVYIPSVYIPSVHLHVHIRHLWVWARDLAQAVTGHVEDVLKVYGC